MLSKSASIIIPQFLVEVNLILVRDYVLSGLISQTAKIVGKPYARIPVKRLIEALSRHKHKSFTGKQKKRQSTFKVTLRDEVLHVQAVSKRAVKIYSKHPSLVAFATR